MTSENWDKINNYFFIIQVIAERANDECAAAIMQVAKDAMNFTWKLQDEENADK